MYDILLQLLIVPAELGRSPVVFTSGLAILRPDLRVRSRDPTQDCRDMYYITDVCGPGSCHTIGRGRAYCNLPPIQPAGRSDTCLCTAYPIIMFTEAGQWHNSEFVPAVRSQGKYRETTAVCSSSWHVQPHLRSQGS